MCLGGQNARGGGLVSGIERRSRSIAGSSARTYVTSRHFNTYYPVIAVYLFQRGTTRGSLFFRLAIPMKEGESALRQRSVLVARKDGVDGISSQDHQGMRLPHPPALGAPLYPRHKVSGRWESCSAAIC